MTILPSVVSTTVQLVGNLVSSAKNARDLAKASSDHELKASISELYDALLDVKAHVLELDEENRRLVAELARKGQVVGPTEQFGYFFYNDKPEQPLCPKCFQSQQPNGVFLGPLYRRNGGKFRKCPVCDYGNYEESPKQGGAVVAVPSISSRSRGYL